MLKRSCIVYLMLMGLWFVAPLVQADPATSITATTISEAFESKLRKFWEAQATSPNPNLASEIVGEYHGAFHCMDFRAPRQTTGLIMRFLADGTCETNLKELFQTNPRPRLPAELGSELVKGQYRVLSPTQLLLSPGQGVTSFGVGLRQGRLTFYHHGFRACFTLQKTGTDAPKPEASLGDAAAYYRGVMLQSGDSKGETAELTFTPGGGVVFGKNTAQESPEKQEGTCLQDDAGHLVFHERFGGFDYIGSSTASFFDWCWQGRMLYVNHFRGAYDGGAYVLSPFNEPVTLEAPELVKELTRGIYRGRAFRSTRDGKIEEFDGISLQFSADGTCDLQLPKAFHARQQYYPEDIGPYRALTRRHLLMGDSWSGRRVTNAGITDVLLEGDRLCFTSLARKAYFVLQRQRP